MAQIWTNANRIPLNEQTNEMPSIEFNPPQSNQIMSISNDQFSWIILNPQRSFQNKPPQNKLSQSKQTNHFDWTNLIEQTTKPNLTTSNLFKSNHSNHFKSNHFKSNHLKIKSLLWRWISCALTQLLAGAVFGLSCVWPLMCICSRLFCSLLLNC